MRSSFCRFGDCVEVEVHGGEVRVSNTRSRIAVWFDLDEWAAFLAGVRNGEFDVPPAGDAHEPAQAGPPK